MSVMILYQRRVYGSRISNRGVLFVENARKNFEATPTLSKTTPIFVRILR